jgi:hypothetical protein
VGWVTTVPPGYIIDSNGGQMVGFCLVKEIRNKHCRWEFANSQKVEGGGGQEGGKKKQGTQREREK